jgi:alkylhydroperoxidase/carboxymuconolactone decarboxylase family protein YurZ
MNKPGKTNRGWTPSRARPFACLGIMILLVLAARAEEASYDPVSLIALCRIAAAGAAGRFDAAEQLFKEGKDAGLGELQMYEAGLNLLPYIGYPRTLSTMARFQAVYPDYLSRRSNGAAPRATERWHDHATTTWGVRGARIQEKLAGGPEKNAELIQRLTIISPELTEWVAYDDFGRVFGRAGLSLIEREAIVLGALVAQGAPQIAFHYKAMLRVGGDDALIDTLLDSASGFVDEDALSAARRYIAKERI